MNKENASKVWLLIQDAGLYLHKQELYNYFFSFFEKNGFTLWSLTPIFRKDETGELLQFDAVFIRK